MKLLTKVGRIFDRANDILAVFSIALIILMMLSISLGVVTRLYFMAFASGEIAELSEWSLVYITFLATTWLLRREGHVNMTLLLDRLNPSGRWWLNVTTSILATIACLIVAYYGVKVTWGLFQTDYLIFGVLRPPKFIILAVIPLGCFLLFIQFLRRTYGYLSSQKVIK